MQVWDFDETTRHDHIATLEAPLGKIVGAQTLSLPIHAHHHPKAALTVHAAPFKESNDILKLALQGARLAAKDAGFMGIGGKSDPYFVINRLNADGSKLRVFASKPLMKDLNPVWPPADIRVSAICNGEYDAPIELEVWDWDSSSDHDLIGVTPQTTVRQLLEFGAAKQSFALKDPKKVSKKGYTDSGLLFVAAATLIRVPSFPEYLLGGCQLNMISAVDFTGSNGDPTKPTSLHFSADRVQPTQYLQAIMSCGGILLEYDSDKSVPYFGFGGQLPDGSTSHCFAMNGNPAAPEVPGIPGMVGAYWQALSVVRLSGPTYFAPIIRKTIELARGETVTQEAQKYTVLLLLTDGAFNDEKDTVEAIIDASQHPISIIIVGIGPADFAAMERLDADTGLLRSGSKVAARDIVQFVPFRNFSGPYAGAELAKAVLKEVPAQMVAYFM
jgi:hypothetical protein